MYGETHGIFSREFFCLPDMAPIREIYCLRIFFDLGYIYLGVNTMHLEHDKPYIYHVTKIIYANIHYDN